MKLIDQCCTKAQGKRLKELGVSIESYFLWSKTKDEPFEGWALEGDEDEFYGAYTVAELGVALTDDIRSYRFEDSWQIYYPSDSGMAMFLSEDCDTEAQIRAAFLIWILETDLLTPEEVNTRIQD